MTRPETRLTVARLGLFARLTGVLTSPRAVYTDVVAHPRSFGILAVILAVVIASTAAFLSTEVGRTALVDEQIRALESFGRTVTDAQYQRFEQMAPYAPYLSAAGQLVSLPLAALAISGIVYVVFNALFGGDASFKQLFAVVAHSGVVIGLKQVVVLPLDYARESLSSATNLAVFLPMLDETSFAARLLGTVDLFHIWWALNLAIGLGILHRRRTAPIATGVLVVYAAIVLVVAVVTTVLSSGA